MRYRNTFFLSSHVYKKGDAVLVWNLDNKVGNKRKYTPKWRDGYTYINEYGRTAVLVHNESNKIIKIHKTKIRKKLNYLDPDEKFKTNKCIRYFQALYKLLPPENEDSNDDDKHEE